MKFNRLAIVVLMLVGVMVLSACAPSAPDKAMDMEEKEEAVMHEEEDMKEESGMQEEAMDEPKEDEMMDEETEGYVVKSFDGKEVNLMDGQKTYVKVWASWCSVCLSGLEELNELYASEADFRVINVVAPGQFGEMSEEKLVKWWAGLEADYPDIEIMMDMDGRFFKDMGVMAFPTSYYIDSNDKVVDFALGHSTNERIFEKMSEIE